MKFYLLPVLMLLCTCGFAQQPTITDDLNTGMDTIVAKYKLSYKLDPVKYNAIINRARKDAYRRIKSGNSQEKTLKRLAVDYYLRNLLPKYKTFYHWGDKVNPMADAQNKYVDSLMYSNTDLNNEELYKRSADYREWIDAYLEKMNQTKYKSDTAVQWAKGVMLPNSVVFKEIKSQFIREYECYKHAGIYLKVTTDSVQAKKIFQDYNAVATNAYYRGEIQEIYNNYKRSHTAGAPAPDFTYTAVDGNKVTLSNLRGKYIYIDVWATWCGPCKMEIPFLMKLEEKYKGKEIQFVSLSVDKQADAAKWREYVTDNKLTGFQVMADSDFQSGFVKKMNIALIPRFILIDPSGNVVDGEAKRPSDPELSKQLNKLLGLQAGPFKLSQYARQTDFSGHWQLNKSKTKFGDLPEYAISRALNVTKTDTALLVDRTNLNKDMVEKHYSETFKLDGQSTQTTANNDKPEVDSIENDPDTPALTLGITIKSSLVMTANITEIWRLEDGGKTLVVDRQVAVAGMGMVEIIGYYDKL